METTRAVLALEEYRAELLGLVAGPVGVEDVPVGASVGRALAAPAVATGPVPAFANSAMDGYAVRWADVAHVPATLGVVAEVPAGSGDDPALAPGGCARIMTGAPVPTDADTIVPVELTDGGTERVVVRELPERGRGAHVRHAGEDLSAGDPVLPAGAVVTSAGAGALAGAGVATVAVRRRPVVTVLATGDELVPAGEPLGLSLIHI